MTIGSRVMVAYPTKDVAITDKMRKFNGKITTVSKVCVKRPKNWTVTTYHLNGCVTDYGIPYEFCREWLVPLDNDEVME